MESIKPRSDETTLQPVVAESAQVGSQTKKTAFVFKAIKAPYKKSNWKRMSLRKKVLSVIILEAVSGGTFLPIFGVIHAINKHKGQMRLNTPDEPQRKIAQSNFLQSGIDKIRLNYPNPSKDIKKEFQKLDKLVKDEDYDINKIIKILYNIKQLNKN